MKVSKSFKWEAAHRLPAHGGDCANLHGHSYLLRVDLHGEPDASGMVIDFKVVKSIIQPLIDAWDHATFVAEHDHKLEEAIKLIGGKIASLPYDSTSENLCRYVADYLLHQGHDQLSDHGIIGIGITIQETQTCSASLHCVVEKNKQIPTPFPEEELLKNY